MTRKSLVLLAAGGSAALLLGALAFQFLGGLPPCKLCIWQRWPHVAAVIFGALWFVRPSRVWLGLGAAAAAVTGAIGVYHAGVEQKWWQGPTTCTSGSIEGLSTDALLDRIMNAPVVRCDEIPWELFSISMAGWNAILSFVLAGLWILALRRD